MVSASERVGELPAASLRRALEPSTSAALERTLKKDQLERCQRQRAEHRWLREFQERSIG